MYNYALKESGPAVALGDEEKVLDQEITSEVQSDFADFEALEQDRRELFDRIEKETMDLAPNIRLIIAERVMEHSPKDGVELATLLAIPAQDILNFLLIGTIKGKYPTASDNLHRVFERLSPYMHIENELLDRWREGRREQAEASNFSGIKGETIGWERWLGENLTFEGKSRDHLSDLAQRIDDYYAVFLEKRKIGPISEEVQLRSINGISRHVPEKDKVIEPTKTEKSGERVLQWLEDARQGRYFGEPVRKALWQKMFGNEEYNAEKLEKAIEKLKLNEIVAHEIMHEPLVPKSAIAVVLLTYDNPNLKGSDRSKLIRKYDAGDPDVVNNVKDFLSSLGPSAEWKPYSIMVKGEASHAQSTLTKELTAGLVGRYGEGVKIAPNSQTGKYEVKDERNREIRNNSWESLSNQAIIEEYYDYSASGQFPDEFIHFIRNNKRSSQLGLHENIIVYKGKIIEVPDNLIVHHIVGVRMAGALSRGTDQVVVVMAKERETPFVFNELKTVEDFVAPLRVELESQETKAEQKKYKFEDFFEPVRVKSKSENGEFRKIEPHIDGRSYLVYKEHLIQLEQDFLIPLLPNIRENGDILEFDSYNPSEDKTKRRRVVWQSAATIDEFMQFVSSQEIAMYEAQQKKEQAEKSIRWNDFWTGSERFLVTVSGDHYYLYHSPYTTDRVIVVNNGDSPDGRVLMYLQPEEKMEDAVINDDGVSFKISTNQGLINKKFSRREIKQSERCSEWYPTDIERHNYEKAQNKEQEQREYKFEDFYELQQEKGVLGGAGEPIKLFASRYLKNRYLVFYQGFYVDTARSFINSAEIKGHDLIIKYGNFGGGVTCSLISNRSTIEDWSPLPEEIVAYKKDHKEKKPIELTEWEKRDLELVNLLAGVQAGKFDDGAVFDYFKKYYPTDKKMSLKDQILNFVAHSKGMVKTLNDTLRGSPKLFLNTMGAKQDNLSEAYVEHLLISLFPEIRVNREKAERAEREKSGRFGGGRFNFGREALAQAVDDPEISARALLSGAEYTAFEGADPKNGKEAEVVRLRESVTGMLVSGTYGRYNSSSHKWEKIPLDLSKEDSGVTREITMEISDTRGLREVVLPRLSSGKILSDRVKGLAENGQEVTLETQVNRFGESLVTVPTGIKKILYSQTEDLVPKVPTDCGAEEYEKFKRQVKQAGGEVLTEKLARLPDDMRMFLDSLLSRPPKEQVQAVEAFVRRYGYYDFDNAEVVKEKQGKSLEEILSIMEIRLQELRRQPDLTVALNNKKYAGVCADFALLATAMMRELGLPSGVISGFRLSPEQKSVTTKHAHGIAFALWPSADGKAEIIEVDGTPHGVTAEQEALLATFRKPSLLEKEKKVEQMGQEIFKANEVKLQEFEKILAENDLERIKSLSNGELERVLNALLANVREPHYNIIQTVLNAGRYAGFDIKKLRSPEADVNSQVAFQRFLEGEIGRERLKAGPGSNIGKFSRGSELLDLIHNFADRYEQDEKGGGSRAEAFETVQMIIETAGNRLDPLEIRSAIAIIQYLEALKL